MGFLDWIFGSSRKRPTRPEDNLPFKMVVADFFKIKLSSAKPFGSRVGTVVSGVIESGTLKVGDKVVISNQSGPLITASVNAIEMSRSLLEKARTGDEVGLFLEGVEESDVRREYIVTKQ